MRSISCLEGPLGSCVEETLECGNKDPSWGAIAIFQVRGGGDGSSGGRSPWGLHIFLK